MKIEIGGIWRGTEFNETDDSDISYIRLGKSEIQINIVENVDFINLSYDEWLEITKQIQKEMKWAQI